MSMMNGGWGQRLWLSGAVACVVSLGSAVAQAGIGGSDLLVRANGIGGSDLDVLGVVESTSSSAVTVSGQSVRLTAGTKITSAAGGSPAKGALVAVYGTINSDGTISASEVSVLAHQYVAGATTLYVRGVVKSVNAAVATAKVGNLSVDFSSSLASGSSSISAGSVAEFAGLQTSGSVLYASKSGVVKPAGIGGSDSIKAAGIGGSDLIQAAGIGGSDLVKAAGIGGSDLVKAAGIGGSDVIKAAGIGGSDLIKAAGIGGSD